MASNFPIRDGKVVLSGVQNKTDAQQHIIHFLEIIGAVEEVTKP